MSPRLRKEFQADLPSVQFPDILMPLLNEPHPYKVIYGGRGGLKTMNIAQALVILGSCTSIRVLCGREIQKSIKDSVHQELCDAIVRCHLEWYYKILDTQIVSRRNGTFFIFSGLKSNVTSIKSTAGLNIFWGEEAEGISKHSWETLEPTLRTPWILPFQFWPQDTVWTNEELELGGRWVDPEIWVSFNPYEETDETYVKFVGGDPPKPGWKPPTDSWILKTSWRDNPWFPENLRRQKDHLEQTDYDAFLHVWEGQPRKMSAAQILRGKYVKENFNPEPGWDGPYFGTDWGFSQDPTAIVKCWIYQRRLYIEYEAFGYGVETDDTPTLLSQIPGSAENVNRADCARPETISYCRRHGHPLIIPCTKWAGSVEDGVAYLRGEFDQIVVHPRCEHILEECRLYSFAIDPNTQEVLPKIVDKHNHGIDAIRYAIGPLIKGAVKLPGNWWRRWDELAVVEKMVTVKYVTITVDEVSEGAAEQRAVIQLWGVGGFKSMYLMKEESSFGLLPTLMEDIAVFWADVSRHYGTVKPASELWLESKSVGQTLIRALRQKGIPAREWNVEDTSVNDPSWRAKQASIHLADGRVYAPLGPCAVVGEIEGLATNAMTLALLIWQRRGGGIG